MMEMQEENPELNNTATATAGTILPVAIEAANIPSGWLPFSLWAEL